MTKGLGSSARGAGALGARGACGGAQAGAGCTRRWGAQARQQALGHAGAAVGAGEHKRGSRRWGVGWHGRRRTGHWGARGAGARGRGSRRRARTSRRPGRGLGVLLGQQAVHSVHSACFDPVSTQYCS